MQRLTGQPPDGQPTDPRQGQANDSQSRAMIRARHLMGDPTDLIDEGVNTFNPNKPFTFTTTTKELPYSKPPANVKRSSYATVPEPDQRHTFTPLTQQKRKAQAANLYNDESPLTDPGLVKKSKPSFGAGRTAAPKTPMKRKRKTKGPPIQQRAIPRSFDECDEADQLLITMRDNGAEWEEIVAKWKALTHEPKVGKSTLPNRYNRLKENFSVIREEDSARLIAAKREVEESFERGKWATIAARIRHKGGEEYSAAVLQRQYKKLMLGVGARPPPGVRDPDFDGIEPLPSSPDPRDFGGGMGSIRGAGRDDYDDYDEEDAELEKELEGEYDGEDGEEEEQSEEDADNDG